MMILDMIRDFPYPGSFSIFLIYHWSLQECNTDVKNLQLHAQVFVWKLRQSEKGREGNPVT